MSEVILTTPQALQELIERSLSDLLSKYDSQVGVNRTGRSDWLTHREAAEYLRTDEGRLYQMVSNKTVPFHKMGKSNRFSRTELDEWLRSST